MSAVTSDFRRLLSSTGLYAASGLAQQAVGFLLIPFYTRLIDPSEYGVLEIFNTASAIGFACLTMGLSSAINKVYHRDCQSAEQRRAVLATALTLDAPILLLAVVLVLAFATPISLALTGSADNAALVPLLAGNGLAYSLSALLLAGLRAQERAQAFSLLSLVQFIAALALNITFVAGLGLGVRGVLWGNLLSNSLQLVLALAVARRGSVVAFSRELSRPLLSFGLYLVPVMLAGWVMDMSDRYFLRLFDGLDAVAVYGVGYKFGMILQVAVVWPFQLAWPAFAFGISKRADHELTFARTLTYLAAVMLLAVVGLALVAPVGLPMVVGPAYRDAAAIIPIVALAYACNGIQYAVAPGVHIGGYTRWLTAVSIASAALNVGLNLLLIPRFGMFGAAWSTVLAFAALAAITTMLSTAAHPVPWEWGRLAKLLGAGLLAYVCTAATRPAGGIGALLWSMAGPLLLLPLLLFVSGWLQPDERAWLRRLMQRFVPLPSERPS